MDKSLKELVSDYLKIKNEIENLTSEKENIADLIMNDVSFNGSIEMNGKKIASSSRSTYSLNKKLAKPEDVAVAYPDCVKTEIKVDAEKLFQVAPDVVNKTVSNFLVVTKA